MNQLALISIIITFLTIPASAQKTRIDTLYTGLNKATSFSVANDAIYIVESGAHRITKTDLNGKIIEQHGNKGGGNYQFDKPHSIATSTGLKIYVSDPGNNRIQVFDKRWQYLSSIKSTDNFGSRREIEPTFLSVNNLGEVIFYDRRNKNFGKYDEDGAFLDNIPLPDEVKSVNGLQIKDDKMYILDKKSGYIHRLSGNGFYETFYEAEDVESFFYGSRMIRIEKNEVFILKMSHNILIHFPEKTIQAIELNGAIFILTENKLLKISD